MSNTVKILIGALLALVLVIWCVVIGILVWRTFLQPEEEVAATPTPLPATAAPTAEQVEQTDGLSGRANDSGALPEARHPSRGIHRVLQGAESVDQALIPGRLTRQHPSVGQPEHLIPTKIPAVHDCVDELIPHVVHQPLQDLSLFLRQLPGRGSHVLQASALHDFQLDADFPKQLLGVWKLHDHTDGTRDRSWKRENRVGRERNVIASRCSDCPDPGDQWTVVLHPQPLELGMYRLRGAHSAPGRPDFEHEGTDRGIVPERFKFSDETGLGVDDPDDGKYGYPLLRKAGNSAPKQQPGGQDCARREQHEQEYDSEDAGSSLQVQIPPVDGERPRGAEDRRSLLLPPTMRKRSVRGGALSTGWGNDTCAH